MPFGWDSQITEKKGRGRPKSPARAGIAFRAVVRETPPGEELCWGLLRMPMRLFTEHLHNCVSIA